MAKIKEILKMTMTNSLKMIFLKNCAGGEMADTLALGASAARHGGSSPLPRTAEKF